MSFTGFIINLDLELLSSVVGYEDSIPVNIDHGK
jgi:hypothetical protein